MVKLRLMRLLAVGMVLCLSASMAMAQDQQRGQRGGGRGFGGGGGFGGGSRGILSLITNEEVQKDLAVDADTVAKLKKVADDSSAESRKEMEALPRPARGNDLSAEDRAKQFAEMGAKTAEIRAKVLAKYTPQLKEILNETQFTRLKQINWQSSLNGALADAEVIKAIDLTKEQTEKIATVGKEYDEKSRALRPTGGGGAGGGNFAEIMTKIQELNKERDTKTLDVLSADQKAKFATLKGKEFDLAKLRGGRGGPGGGGRPAGARPATEEKKAN